MPAASRRTRSSLCHPSTLPCARQMVPVWCGGPIARKRDDPQVTPSRGVPWRAAAAVLMIAALAGNGLLIVTTLRTPAESVRDIPLADAVRRWDAARSILFREGISGYVVHPPPASAAEEAEAVLAFRLAQYAAIPAALEEGTGRPVVVVDSPPG